MKTQNIIEDLKSLRGANVSIFGQPCKLSEEVGEYEIDTIDLFEAIAENEIEIENDDDFMEELEELGFEEKCDNSYNWNSPLSNDIDFATYSLNREIDTMYLYIKAHRYGDVRCNYTEGAWYKFDNMFEMLDKFYECNKYLSIEYNGKTYDINVVWNCESIEVYDNEDGGFVCMAYGDKEDIINCIKEALNEE